MIPIGKYVDTGEGITKRFIMKTQSESMKQNAIVTYPLGLAHRFMIGSVEKSEKWIQYLR